jgi:predicted nucleotidyltransferase
MALLSRDEITKIIIETLRPLGVERIALFGSFARNESHPHDIDILVRLRSAGKRKPIGMKWFTLNEELGKKIGLPVDLVSENSLSPRLKSIIDKDIEVIYDEAG